MRRFIVGALGALMLCALPVAGLAAGAGTAKGVDPAADAVSNNQTRTLVVGADVNIGDLIQTGDKGQVEILFSDNTKLVVGPNSNLEIQDYLIRNNGSAGKFAVDMLAGTFRFVTGTSPKPDYIINTPTGTIGVRGTGFDVYVDANGVAHILMYDGQTQMCEKHAKECQALAALCQTGEINADGTAVIGNMNDLPFAERNALKVLFHYSQDESSLDYAFRIPGAFECTHKPPDITIPQPPQQTSGSGKGCPYGRDEGGECNVPG